MCRNTRCQHFQRCRGHGCGTMTDCVRSTCRDTPTARRKAESDTPDTWIDLAIFGTTQPSMTRNWFVQRCFDTYPRDKDCNCPRRRTVDTDQGNTEYKWSHSHRESSNLGHTYLHRSRIHRDTRNCKCRDCRSSNNNCKCIGKLNKCDRRDMSAAPTPPRRCPT